MTPLQEMIYSNDYADLILPIPVSDSTFLSDNSSLGPQLFGGRLGMIHLPRDGRTRWDTLNYSYIPNLFALQDTTSLEASGILRFRSQPNLGYRGKNVLIGFIDSGIDYTQKCFQRSDGNSRILSIWDQTIPSTTPPFDMGYGTEYTQSQIQQALQSNDPFSIVPSFDSNGHGTFLAGTAAGSEDPSSQFSGAAPESMIAMVKLKPAKQYLRDYFFIPYSAEAYQETDIMMGLRYLLALSIQRQLPLVLCLGLGSNQGDHNGTTPLERLLDYFVDYQGCFASVAAGNETGKAHHFFGTPSYDSETETVELLVSEKDSGFTMEIWSDSLSLYQISITSPLGEQIPFVQPRQGFINTYPFLAERTIIEIRYEIAEYSSGSQLIQIRFQNPTPGIWKLLLSSTNDQPMSPFHIWLPISNFLSPDTIFLNPNPYTTLTIPSTAQSVLSVSTYDAYTGSLYIHSGRGFTREQSIKPDLTAPGVNVYGPSFQIPDRPAPLNAYVRKTGSSIAAAITAGAMALFINWSMERTPLLGSYINNRALKNYFTRGALRSPGIDYPNPEWGYGILDLYGIFESLL